MSEHERLVELLERAPKGLRYEDLPDYLLENGVIVPPVKVGAVIYYVELEINADKTGLEPKIHRTTVTDISISNNYTMYSTSCRQTFPDSLFGIMVFLTKEEAEKALKEVSK